MSAQWYGFADPHSGLSHYRIAIGTKEGEFDVVPLHDVGLVTGRVFNCLDTHPLKVSTCCVDFSIGGLSLIPGATYYFTVKAFNGVRLYKSVSSDGVVVDQTPPLPGVVWDGSQERDVQFQPLE